jgi:hypothetical protein
MKDDGCGTDRSITHLDVFLNVFLPHDITLRFLVMQNHIHANHYDNKKTSKEELPQFFGILIFTTKYEWEEQRNLWEMLRLIKYKQAHTFGTVSVYWYKKRSF